MTVFGFNLGGSDGIGGEIEGCCVQGSGMGTGFEEEGAIDRLGEVVGAAGVEAFAAVLFHGVGSEGDKGKGESGGADSSSGGSSVEHGI